MRLIEIQLLITATVTALMSGFFFAYSISVSLALGKLGDHEFLLVMQHINREVQNVFFFICFFGALIMLPITAFEHYNQRWFVFVLIAALLYILGVFLVTVLINVPLNNKLELFNLSEATEASARRMRNIFENKWNFWNNVRTITCLVSVFFMILACLSNKQD